MKTTIESLYFITIDILHSHELTLFSETFHIINLSFFLTNSTAISSDLFNNGVFDELFGFSYFPQENIQLDLENSEELKFQSPMKIEMCNLLFLLTKTRQQKILSELKRRDILSHICDSIVKMTSFIKSSQSHDILQLNNSQNNLIISLNHLSLKMILSFPLHLF